MSYPSITPILEKSHLHLDSATDEQLQNALWQAFETDLSLGMEYLKKFAENVKNHSSSVLEILEPNSDLGKQILRLLGTDIARKIVEQKLGIYFGLYNCCVVKGALKKEDLDMTYKEQIQLQNGELAHADC